MMDYDKVLSQKVKAVKPSGIRKFFDVVSTMGDAISLGVGEPDFATPWTAKRAAIRAIEKGRTFYTSNWGLPALREEIAKYMKESFCLDYSDKEIVVTVGGSEAIDNCLRAIISDGDEVLIPEPSFVCYTPLTLLAGGVPVPVPTCEADRFKLTADMLKAAITPKTKALIMPYPNNPTGAIMTRDDLEPIAEVLRGTGIVVLSDEIYSELTYDKKHVCFAELPGMKERTIVINGFSKTYAMTGWRLGYACGPAELMAALCKVHQYAIMSAPTISQFAACDALRFCRADVDRMRDEYNLRRLYLVDALKRMGLSCFEPEGAFYVFPSIKSTGLSSGEFCDRLLSEQKLAVVPGSAFGESGEGFVRISYSYSVTHIMEAMKRLNSFITSIK